MKFARIFAIICVLVAGGLALRHFGFGPSPLVLTGIVTTQDVILSPQISGRVSRLLVKEGDPVKRDQLLAVIAPDELKAEQAYYSQSAEGLAVQVEQGQAALHYQQRETAQQIQQARAVVAAAEAQRREASADLDNAKAAFDRVQALEKTGAVSAAEVDRQRATFETGKAKLEAAEKQLDAQRAALALAQAAEDQVSMKRSALAAAEHERAAAAAQTQKAEVRVGYSEIRSPVDGLVDVRAAREGETVTPGQPMLTLVDPDDLWVRADVEESYIDRVKIGDTLTVRLPSGEERSGTVFYRGIDAGFATQRDVSRTKRDIKTFEIRLRLDNKDRRLAVGMTAYVLFPTS
jgi:multidrug resistance efflux pump